MRLFAILLMFGLGYSAAAQRPIQSIQVTYGSSKMSQLEDFINGVFGGASNTVMIQEFPSFFGYEVMGRIQQEGYYAGFWLKYQSNRSSLSSEDPSLSYKLDIVISTPSVGLIYQHQVVEEVPFWIDFRAGAAFNFLKMSEDIESPDINSDESVRFRSVNLQLTPGLSYRVGSETLFVETSVYYNFGKLGSGIALSGNPNVGLMNRSGEDINVDWSGFGIGFGLGFRI